MRTVKSAKMSMFIFMLHFAKISLLRIIKNILFGLFIILRVFSLVGLWATPLIINFDMSYSRTFNMYYIVISIVGMLLGIVIYGIHGDMEHAVYLHKENWELSNYYKLLVKLDRFF